MKIAIVIEQFVPSAGGNERSTRQMAEELAKRGHHVTVIAGHADDPDPPEGVDFAVFRAARSSSVFRLLRFARWAKETLDKGDYDVSLSVTMAVPADVVQPRGGTVRETQLRNIAMRSSSFARLKKSLTLKLDAKQQMLLRLEKQTIESPRVKRFAAVSGYVVRQLEQHYAVASERVSVVYNASVMPEVGASQKAEWRAAVRSGFQIPDDGTVFLFAAQNPRLKGFGSLVHATQQLAEAGKEPTLLLAGRFGYSHHAWIAELGLREHVRFMGATQQMPALYAAADVTVLPSFYDPCSKVVLESLMMGTPAVTSAFNGASEFVTPDSGQPRGRVVEDPADARALAAAMTELTHADVRERCAAAAAGLRSQLSMERHIDQLEQVLSEAAEEAARIPAPESADDAQRS